MRLIENMSDKCEDDYLYQYFKISIWFIRTIFPWKTLFFACSEREKSLFLRGVISLQGIRYSFSMRLWQWQNGLHLQHMKTLSSWWFIILQYLYLLSLSFILLRKTEYSASNIILINIPLPVFIYNFRSVVYISRQSLYIQTHRFWIQYDWYV